MSKEIHFPSFELALKHGMSMFDQEFFFERYEFKNNHDIYVIKFPCEIREIPGLDLYIVVEYNICVDTYELYVEILDVKSQIFYIDLPKKYRNNDFWQRMDRVYG